MSLTPGSRIGPYEILAAIGAGGMGEVYRARDTKLNRDVAIKVLPDLFASDPERLARFEREAQVLASLNHPHIAQIYGVIDLPPALVMELVDGRGLDVIIRDAAAGPRRRGLAVTEAVGIAKQVAEALVAAHECGVIHRDLKPGNVVVRDDGTVKVLDFGLAKVIAPVTSGVGSGDSPTLTSPVMTGVGVILGTAAYLAPEQARGKAVDRRADVWAFSCMLFEMLTGRRAFAGESVTDTIAAVIEREPDWTALPADTPPGVARLLRRGLVKDPAARLRDAGDALLELTDALPDDRTRQRASRGVRPALAAAAIVAVAVASAVVTRALIGGADRAARWATRAVEFPLAAGDPSSLAVSADGETLAWVAPAADGARRIWIRSLSSSTPKELPGTDEATYPFLAPDGHAVGFFADGELRRVDVASGTTQVLAQVPTVSLGGSWGSNDIIIFSSRFGIQRIPAAGGAAAIVAPLDRTHHENSLRFPQSMPDGRHFVYVARSGRPEENAAYLGSLDGPPVRLFQTLSKVQYVPPGDLLFLRGGTLFAQRFVIEAARLEGEAMPIARGVTEGTVGVGGGFAASFTGVLAFGTGTPPNSATLHWMDKTGLDLGTVGAAAAYNQVRIGPDGHRVAASIADQVRGSRSVWILDEARPPARLTFPSTHDWEPVWSPDGSRIAFASYRDGPLNLYAKSANGEGGEAAVLLSDDQKDLGDWAGHFIVYREVRDNGKGQLVVADTTQRDKRVNLTESTFDARSPRFSSDGRWIAYVSYETGRNEIVVQPFPPTGARWQISVAGGDEPVWCGDGRELFYVDQAGMLVTVAVDGTTPSLGWGKPRPLFRVGPTPTGGTGRYDVSRDGKRFLVVVPAPAGPPRPATVLLNWTTLLRH